MFNKKEFLKQISITLPILVTYAAYKVFCSNIQKSHANIKKFSFINSLNA